MSAITGALEGLEVRHSWHGVDVHASLDQLTRLGWVNCQRKLVQRSTYPASGRIVVEKGDVGLEHLYTVSDDTSSYQGDHRPVSWKIVRFEKVELERAVVLGEADL